MAFGAPGARSDVTDDPNDLPVGVKHGSAGGTLINGGIGLNQLSRVETT